MSSTFLPQGTFTIPKNPTQCSSKKLGISSSASCCSSSSTTSSLHVSMVSTNVWGLTYVPVSAKSSKRDFIVKAESVSEGEVAELESEVEAEAKAPRKPIIKLGDIMGILNKRAIEASDNQRPTPDIRTGDIVEIKLEVPENRKRLSVYKGIVISKQNAGIHTTIRIRRIVAGVGVEIVFPVYSPNIKEIKVVNHRKVRRARLYYLRDKLPRLSTFK